MLNRMLSDIWSCFRGPKLYRIYPEDKKLVVVDPYDANRLERYGDLTIMSIHLMSEIMKYGSPLLIPYLYRRGMFSPEGSVFIINFIVAVSLAYVVAWISRGFGRALNPSYRSFLSELQLSQRAWSPAVKEKMLKYDFEYTAWPVEYKAPPYSPYVPPQSSKKPFNLLSIPLKPLSWILAHTVGLSLVYPGSTALLQAGLHPALMQGRASLIRRYGGVRYKLKTSDGNIVDTMYIHRSEAKGKTLIINCEGNGGYYEIGVSSPAVESGHSVLGWNHPGFGWSTGRPFPEQERSAADAVIQFAINELHYEPSNIMIYGWSIGGFTASWLAMRYPDVKCIILDATFDVLLPLAVSRMPQKLSPLIEDAVKTYIDLNIAEQLIQYQGTIRLIRRSQDEMIVTDMDDASTNRANNLLIKLLTFRYPNIINETLLWEYLKLKPMGKEQFVSNFNLNQTLLTDILSAYKDEPFPLSLGGEGSSSTLNQETKDQLTIFLAQKYMLDYDSSHCTALPLSYLDHIYRQTEESSAQTHGTE